MAYAASGSSFIRRDACNNFPPFVGRGGRHRGGGGYCPPSNKVVAGSEDKILRDLGVVISRPKFPDYSTVFQRIVSFENWPDPATRQLIGMFSDAGFFYAGTSDADDVTQCFYCSLRLNKWSAETSVWKAHARWKPDCDYVLLCKGPTFIKDSINSGNNNNNNDKVIVQTAATAGENKDADSSPNATMINNVEILDEKYPSWRGDGNVQIVSEMGFNLNLIATAIVSNDFDTFDILDQMLDEMEKLEKVQSKLSESTLPNGPAFEEVSTARPTPPDCLCKICMSNESSIVLLPCSHLVCCPMCSPALNQCPLCRSALSGRLRIYSG